MRFKSVLGAFIFILVASFIALIVFIQTKSFGRVMTNVISDISQKKFETQLKIRDISLSLFPPGIEFNDVDVSKKIAVNESFEAEFGKIGIYLGLIELEEKNITLGEIKISDSYIKYIGPEKTEELKEIDKKIIDKIFKVPDQLPIRLDSVVIENTKLFYNYELLEAKRVKLYKKEKSFITRFHLAHIRPNKDALHTIDEVWGDGEISKNDISIYRVKIQQDVQTILIKGKIKDYYKIKGASAALNGEMNVYLPSILSDFFPKHEQFVSEGSGRIGFRLNYDKENLRGEADIFLKEIDSRFITASEIRSSLVIENSKIKISRLKLENQGESLDLLNPVEVYDFEKKKTPDILMSVNLQNLHLPNVLQYFGPNFKTLKGELNGEVKVEIKDKNLYIIPKDKFIVNNLGLVTGDGKASFTILMIKKAALSKTLIKVENNDFFIESAIELKNSKLNVQGFVNKKTVSFKVPDSKIDLTDFGNISNLDIKGFGVLAIDVTGPPEETKINIKGKTEAFEILGYHLDRTDKSITINLGESTVEIDKLDSIVGKTRISGNGSVNYKDAEIALGISSNDANSGDLIQILDPIFKDITFLPNDLDFKAKVDVDIFGKYHFKDLKIRSRVDFNDLTAASETINSGSFDLSLSKKIISVKNLECIKGRGSLDGDIIFDLGDKSFNLKLFWENLELQSLQIAKTLGLNLDTLISGKVAGGGSLNDYKLILESTAFDTHSLNYKFEDSNLDLVIQPRRIKGKANFLGNIFRTDFDFGLGKGSHSDLELKFNTLNIKPFLIAMLGKHLENENFSGSATFEAKSSFDYGFENVDLEATLNNLSFNHPEFNINYKSSKPEFLVKGSKISRWALAIKQPDFFVETRGEGTFGNRVSMIQEFHVNSKILEILSSKILSSEGFIRNISRINGNGSKFDFSLSSKSNDLDLSIEQLPVQVNDLKYDIEYANNRLQIHGLTSSLDNGTFSLLGDVFFDGEHPDVNLKFVLDKAEIPIIGDSSMNISGEGIILGNNYPYTVSGEIIINKGHIVEELNEFSSKSAAFSQVRFLPRNQESVVGKMFNINLNVKAENPVRISNSLMDIAFVGEMRLTGNPSRPKAEGRLSSPINSSRIFFKNNEYQIISADINFSPKKEITNPDFDIQALTIISNYKIYPKAYGDLERFNFDLTSEPVLPRNSILSLIAFGYTDEIQTALYAKDQRSLTQVGVGSFVFDRFKISDILNKQFGLQVNLGTVIEQSSTDSLLSGRSQSRGNGQTAGALGRTRSATKIELKKRLDEALTLSVSSTMGGSIGQRQSMNLNYGLSRNIQLEGVYELRTNEEGEADIIYNSIGGDLKFRRTFK
jgi:translocation and assembly module TamB